MTFHLFSKLRKIIHMNLFMFSKSDLLTVNCYFVENET